MQQFTFSEIEVDQVNLPICLIFLHDLLNLPKLPDPVKIKMILECFNLIFRTFLAQILTINVKIRLFSMMSQIRQIRQP